MSKVNVAIAGVGNCASSLVQGVEYYKDANKEKRVPGLMHVEFGDYHVGDIDFVAAFDVNAKKVGKDLSEAIFVDPNCTMRFSEVPKQDVEVFKGEVKDGIGKYLRDEIPVDENQEAVDVANVLEESEADVLVSYMPVGSAEATRMYAEAALEAGVSFVNCIPEFIVSDEAWAKKFKDAGIPCAGDDIKSQVGATILHRVLVGLLRDRGVKINESYQINMAGNTDFLNMIENKRLKSKRTSKTESVTSQIPYDAPIHIVPNNYVPFQDDNKICYIRLEGDEFGDSPVKIDAKLSVEDSPNSAGVVIDAIRAVKLAKDRGIGGPLEGVSAYFFKHPPVQMTDSEAYEAVESFIHG